MFLHQTICANKLLRKQTAKIALFGVGVVVREPGNPQRRDETVKPFPKDLKTLVEKDTETTTWNAHFEKNSNIFS